MKKFLSSAHDNIYRKITTSGQNFYEFVIIAKRILFMEEIREQLTNEQKLKILCVVLLEAVNSVCKVAPSVAIAKAIEMVTKSEAFCRIGPMRLTPVQLLLTSIGFTFGTVAIRLINNMLINDITGNLAKNLAIELNQYMHKLPFSEYQNNKDNFAQGFYEIDNQNIQLVSSVLKDILPAIFDSTLGIGIATYQYGPKMGGLLTTYLFGKVFLVDNIINHMTGLSDKINDCRKKLEQFIESMRHNIINMEAIRLNNSISYEMKEFTKALTSYLDAKEVKERAEIITDCLEQLLPQGISAAIVACIAKGGFMLDEIAELVFQLGYLATINLSTSQISKQFRSLYEIIELNNRCNRINFFPKKQKNKKDDLINLQLKLDYDQIFIGNAPIIEFDNVSFGYNTNQLVLKNISFKIDSGRTLAIVGESGAGKSTIGRLLYRLYEPTSGSIKINGHDIKNIPDHILRSYIGMIPDKVMIHEDYSLKYNVYYGSANEDLLLKLKDLQNKQESNQPDQKDELIEKEFKTIISKAKLENVSMRLGDSACRNLSSGEKQRIGIARLLARSSKIWILDEPTSQVDSANEDEILKDLNALNQGEPKTTLFISHRYSSVKDAQKILFFKSGSIIESGSHDELLQKKGEYAHNWQLQTGVTP
jgi:ATP-binding cassette subfamily B protein